MTEYSKYNFVYQLQKWMDSVSGQTFLNYAYSWGAAIVILGALFKLTHLPGANFMLFLGMGTEAVVFFLSAFDRPFDKTSIGMELKTDSELRREELEGEEAENENQQDTAENIGMAHRHTIIINGGSSSVQGDTAGKSYEEAEGEAQIAFGQTGGVAAPGQAAPQWVAQQQELTPEMAEATSGYVDELKRLTEMLGKVNEQSSRLARDSEEMENLNRTLTGIAKVYEMQLKGASQQIGTIDEINAQTRKMAGQIDQLNKIYTRMIEAMTVNMRGVAPASGSISPEAPAQ